ncbi:SPFH domain-containing protein [Streptomyces sp. NPDC006540]|jgi:regulator of protease activity HflC (stomatin/prohibitin superfamily)|uniref:SPFH domain-containing protein n=1 Tax=Streptomyces sp. NPDC006540 TaxID=3155353 RepID=UPI0033B4E092
MNTTTSEPEGTVPSESPRRNFVIASETTTEIPVHLLFRDDTAPLRPTVVSRRQGTGEQPRVGDEPPATHEPQQRQSAEPGTLDPRTQVPQKPDLRKADARKADTDKPDPTKRRPHEHLDEPDPRQPRQDGSRQQKSGERKPGPQQPGPRKSSAAARQVPSVDPQLAERPGPVLPGWTALVAGGCSLAGIGAVIWGTGAVPDVLAAVFGLTPPPYAGIGIWLWCLLTLGVILALFALGGLGRGQVGRAWVLTLCGDYRGSVRRTGLVWVSPLVLRRRIDVRLRHWRSEPMAVVDAEGTPLRAVVLVVWRVKDTARAALGVADHEAYLREQVEAVTARVFSQLPADAFLPAVPTLRNAEAVGDRLAKTLAAQCAAVGVEVFSAQPVAIDYAPEVAAAMQRRRVAAIDAKHRNAVLTSVVDAVEETVGRLTARGLVDLDDYERKALVKDLTVAFYTGRAGAVEAP